jgi:hypothetical protein
MKTFFCVLLCLLPVASAVGAQDKPTAVAPAKAVDAGAVGVPKPAVDLATGRYKYDVKLVLGGQTMSLKVTTVIEDGGALWMATDTMETPQGTAVDVAKIEKSSLILDSRKTTQGPVAIDVVFSGGKAAGKMNLNGQDKVIDADMGGAIFGDAAGGDQVIATLPLAVGYTTTFRNFDIQGQKVKLEQLSVAGEEPVTVAAGTFNTFRVEITAADGGGDKKTLWVAKDSRKVVKASAVLASMGGAVLTQELLP